MSETMRRHVVGQLAALDDERALGRGRLRLDVAALGRRRGTRRTSSPPRACRPRSTSGCRPRRGIHTVRPFVDPRSGPGSGKVPTTSAASGFVVMSCDAANVSIGYCAPAPVATMRHAVVVRGRREVLVEQVLLERLLQVLEPGEGRLVDVLGLVVRVLLGPVGVLGEDVVEVAEHEELRGPGVAVGLHDRGGRAGRLDRLAVGDELVPRGGDLEAELARRCPCCRARRRPSTARSATPYRPFSVETVLTKFSSSLSTHAWSARLTRVVVGAERLQQRARVVLEDVVHLAGGEARLDQVVALGALRPGLDVDRDVGVLGL